MISRGFGNMSTVSGSSSRSSATTSYTKTGRSGAKSTPAPIRYGEGDRVKHIKFGEGEVTSLIEKSGDYEVTVEFDSGTTRRMMASFAKLTKI